MNQTLANWSKPVSLNSSQTHRNRASFTRWPFIMYYVLLSFHPSAVSLRYSDVSNSPVNFLAIIHIVQSFGTRQLYLCGGHFQQFDCYCVELTQKRITAFHSFSPKKTEDIRTFGCLDLVLRLHNVSPVCFFYSFKSPSGVICSTKKTVALKVVEIIATAR